MATVEVSSGLCGDCRFFKANRMDGTPVGTISLDNSLVVSKGICTAKGGLLLRDLHEKVGCKQKPVAFIPKATA